MRRATHTFSRDVALELNDAIEQMVALRDVISEDALRCAKTYLAEPESQFWRRTGIRTFASEIEAQAFGFKKLATAANKMRPTELSSKETECLAGTAKFSAFKEVKLSLCAIQKVLDCAIVPLDSAPEWTSLKKTIDVRNRLTHAKSKHDYYITNEEISTCGQAIAWFKKLSNSLLRQLNSFVGNVAVVPRPKQRRSPKTGRNDPCPCGSRRKFKHCCGLFARPVVHEASEV